MPWLCDSMPGGFNSPCMHALGFHLPMHGWKVEGIHALDNGMNTSTSMSIESTQALHATSHARNFPCMQLPMHMPTCIHGLLHTHTLGHGTYSSASQSTDSNLFAQALHATSHAHADLHTNASAHAHLGQRLVLLGL
eukprot:1160022-Pelagomonas_calceolata.AAC.2